MLYDLYCSMAELAAPMPLHVQRAALARCRNAKPDLLALLVARTDACDEVLAAGAASKMAKVKAAYLSRPDRTAEELRQAVGREKRVGVLAAVAASEEASAALLEALSQDTRRGVSLAVLANARTPEAAKLLVVERLVAYWRSMPWNTRPVIQEAIEKLSIPCDSLLDNDTHDEICLLVIRSGKCSYQAAERWLTGHIFKELANPRTGHWAARTVITLLETTDDAAVAALLLSQRPAITKSKSQWLTNAFDAAAARFGATSPDQALAAQHIARTSADLDELVSVVDAAILNRDANMVTLVSQNNNIDLGLARRLAQSGLLAGQELFDLAANTKDPAIMAAALFAMPAAITDEMLDETGDPVGVLVSCAGRFADASHRSAHFILARLLSSSFCEASVLNGINWQLLQGVLAGGPESGVEQLAGALTAALADDDRAWSVFNQLADEFVGTTGELLDTVLNLAASFSAPNS